MKKTILFTLCICALIIITSSCNKERTSCIEAPADCFKGRLEIKGLCSNYTIKVVGSNFPSNLFQNTWTDPYTGKTYNNVFALGNPCDFPASIKEGAEFYFSITKGSKNNCVICAGYYPTPDTLQDITILSTPCNKTIN